ncbi:MAG: M36 family metallopeptidase, partial [Acidobacteria bacterium]|nr:M36 family metallopeptidase [Acidobacteriota bacterium]
MPSRPQYLKAPLCTVSFLLILSSVFTDRLLYGQGTAAPPVGIPGSISQPKRAESRGRALPHQAAERITHLRVASAALGLVDLKVVGGEAAFPGAIYGRPGSGKIRGASADAAAQSFLTAFAPYYGLARSELHEVRTEERKGFLPGYREVVLQRSVQGHPLHGAQVRLHLGPEGEFLAAVGDLWGSLEWAGEPALSEDQARALASSIVDRLRKPEGPGPRRGARAEEATVRQVAYPIADQARPAYIVSSVIAADGVDAYDIIVDGISGATLEVVPLTFYAQGQVFRNAALVPQSPQPSTTPGIVPPSPNPPAYVSRVTIPFSISGATELAGNNAIVREHQAWTGEWTDADSGTPIHATSGNFSFPLVLSSTSDVRNYPEAAATNLFYVLGAAHDYFYALGFDEAHGNFQVENFGLGGMGGDPVVALAQLGAGPADGQYSYASNNAWMRTYPDGSSPIMGMYVWGGSGAPPSRIYTTDSSLDPDIVIHEYAHGVTRRLSAGYLPYEAQSGAINEGNSDFFALDLQIPSSAPLAGAYPVATYSVQNFTRGIRSYPYSTDLTVDPLVYGQLGTLSYWGPQVHADGGIWTSTLWELRAALIEALGFTVGRERAAQLVLDGLQLLPHFPSFVDFRDAILTANEFRYGGAHQSSLWKAFAKRGLGALAGGGFN